MKKLTNIKKNYLNFNIKIKNKTDRLFINKDLKNLFQLQIRLNESGHLNRGIADENLVKLTKRQFFGKDIIKFIIYIYSLFFKLINKKPKIFFRSFSASETYENKLFENLKKKNINSLGIISYNKSLKNKLRYVINHTWIFDMIERSLETSSVISKYKCTTNKKLYKKFESKNFIGNISSALKKDIFFISKILVNLNIHGVLIHSDQTIPGYIFIKAARNNKIKCAVLAHGTLKNINLTSVLPLHADKIFVWSQETKDLINHLSRKETAILVKGIKSSIIKTKKNKNKIIFASDPLGFIDRKLEIKFIQFLKKVKNFHDSAKLIFCSHPSDCRTNKIFQKIEESGWNLSQKSIYYEARDAKLVIGGVSSFLFESNQNNIPSIQLLELLQNFPESKYIEDLRKHFKIDNIPQITFDKFIYSLKLNFKNINFSCHKSYIDTSRIINFFCK